MVVVHDAVRPSHERRVAINYHVTGALAHDDFVVFVVARKNRRVEGDFRRERVATGLGRHAHPVGHMVNADVLRVNNVETWRARARDAEKNGRERFVNEETIVWVSRARANPQRGGRDGHFSFKGRAKVDISLTRPSEKKLNVVPFEVGASLCRLETRVLSKVL